MYSITCTGVNILHYRWEREGVEGIIYDDGVDHGEEVSAVARGRIGITEMKEALQLKYDLLRKKLFWDMIKRSLGEMHSRNIFIRSIWLSIG